jgi:fibronectin-binding autotransporter adhesin
LTAHAAGGGGGAAGAYAIRTNMPVTPGNSYNITIPSSAVVPAATADGVRVDGAAVTFIGDAGVTVTAEGGQGGQSRQANGATATGLGGAGSTAASIGDVLFAGGNGASSAGNGGAGGGASSDLAVGGNASGTTAGVGAVGSDAGHNGGNGGGGRTGNAAGNSGNLPGAGGGGAKVTPTGTGPLAGGTGGRGQLILTYTLPLSNTVKADNSLDLTNAASWTAGVPASVGIAKWDNTVTGPNTVSLGADLTFGGISITNPGGAVTINEGNTLTLGTEAVDIEMSGATANLTLNCALALGGPNVWNVTSGRTLTLAGAVSGSQAVTLQGAGKTILSATNTYSGATTINGGTLQLNAADVIKDGATGSTVTVNAGGTLDLNGNSEVLSALNVSPGGVVDSTSAGTPTLTVGGNNAAATINGTVQNTAGSLSLVKEGSGNLTIAGTNTYSGGTTFNAGTMSVSSDHSIGTGSLYVGGTRLSLGAGVTNLTNSITIGANTAATLRGAIESNGGLGTTNVLTGPITITNGVAAGAGHIAAFNGTLDIRSVITSSVNVLQRLGPVIYSGGGTGYNDLYVSGLAIVGVHDGIATSATVRLGAATLGTLDLNGFNQTLAGVVQGPTPGIIGNSSTNANATLTLTGTSTFAGTIVDVINNGTNGNQKVSLTVNSSGTVTLTGTNSYSGNTTVSAGTLALAVASIATNSTVLVANGAVLQLDFAETNLVAGLVTNAVALPPGIYSAANLSPFLAGTGSLEIAVAGPVYPAATLLTNSVSGNTLSLSWPAAQGWRLESQTNALSTGVSTNWSPATDSSVSSTNITIDPTKPTVFYRLIFP